jgi:hypothetical protein
LLGSIGSDPGSIPVFASISIGKEGKMEEEQPKTCAQKYCPSKVAEGSVYCKQHSYLADLSPEQRTPHRRSWIMPGDLETNRSWLVVSEKPKGCVTCGNASVKLNEFMECSSCVQERLDMEFSTED